jgi:rhamnosyltransferase
MNPTLIEGRPVGAVVVTFFPDERLEPRLTAIGREFGPVIVVDNSGDPRVQRRLRETCEARRFDFIANPGNLGLAAALNQGFCAHVERGLQWAIAFDQDSMPAEGFGRTITTAALRPPRAAVTGANWIDEAHPERAPLHLRRGASFPMFFQRTAAEHDLDDVTCVISSGSLFDLTTWGELAGFDQDLFLDLVDTDYCVRAARLGRCIRVAAAARLRHRRGAKRAVHFAGRTFFPAFMPPLRLQYLFRNRVRLLSRHAEFAPHLLSFELVYAAKILAEITVLEDQKLAKLAGCARGIWDGITGRKGRISVPR